MWHLQSLAALCTELIACGIASTYLFDAIAVARVWLPAVSQRMVYSLLESLGPGCLTPPWGLAFSSHAREQGFEHESFL
jgi:hypothetical protein